MALPQKLETGTHLVNGMKDLFLSLRSRREHKAWGVSPRKLWFSSKSPRKRAKDSRNKGAVARWHGLRALIRKCPGAYAPGFTLMPASQAMTIEVSRDLYRDLRLLRQCRGTTGLTVVY